MANHHSYLEAMIALYGAEAMRSRADDLLRAEAEKRFQDEQPEFQRRMHEEGVFRAHTPAAGPGTVLEQATREQDTRKHTCPDCRLGMQYDAERDKDVVCTRCDGFGLLHQPPSSVISRTKLRCK